MYPSSALISHLQRTLPGYDSGYFGENMILLFDAIIIIGASFPQGSINPCVVALLAPVIYIYIDT